MRRHVRWALWGSHVIQKLQLQVIMGIRDSERQQGSRDRNVGLKEDDSALTRNSCEYIQLNLFSKP